MTSPAGRPAVRREVRRFGRRALLVEVGGPSDVLRLRATVDAAGVATETVPGWSTLLVRTAGDPAQVVDWLASVEVDEVEAVATGEAVVVEVAYDGPDLDDVAALVGTTVDEVVALHTRPDYVVVMLGFSRGFPYLAGLDPALTGLSRLATPRTRVPAGSVGIALDQTGIYPLASPGGWRLLGRTDTALFDPTAFPPSPLRPGARVRFEAVG